MNTHYNHAYSKLKTGILDFRFQCFLIIVLSAICSLFLVDLIPVNAGQGWDGASYYQLILDWSNGHLGIANIPYKLIRAGAFLPQIFFYGITGEPPTHLISISRFIAIARATLGGWFAVLACYSLGKIKETKHKITALLLLACYLLSHAVFTMPSHYPLLSEHVALFISGFSLWLWSLNEQKHFLVKGISLGLLAAWSVFVMPLVSVVPMVLLIFPVNTEHSNKNIWPFLLHKNTYFYFLLAIGLIAVNMAVYFIKFVSLPLHNDLLLTRPNGVAPSLINLKLYAAITSIFTMSWALLLLFTCGLRLVCNLSWIRFMMAIAFIIPSLIILYIAPDWNQGLSGPNLIRNLAIQSLQAPGIQIVSLFSYLGPLGLLGVVASTAIILTRRSKELNAAVLISAFFFLSLSIGSETRQFLAIFPILLFISIIIFKDQMIVCAISMVFTLFLLSIGWPMADHMTHALNINADFMDVAWQAFFGRHGPWMSPETIVLFYATIITYLLILLIHIFIKPLPKNNEEIL